MEVRPTAITAQAAAPETTTNGFSRQRGLESEVADLRWYHSIDLPGGITTPGEYDLRKVAQGLPWPDLTGKRCLDIGSRDGFYSFEMERRGAAEVVSVDLDDPSHLQIPGPPRDMTYAEQELIDGNTAFETARRALGSRVERRYISVYELDEAQLGRFDFAVMGTLCHHLRDPVGAMQAARGLIDEHLMVNDAVVPGLGIGSRPLAELMMTGGPFWWAVNRAGQRRMIEAAGFEILEQTRTFVIPYGEGPAHKPPLRGAPWWQLRLRFTLRRGAPHSAVLARPA